MIRIFRVRDTSSPPLLGGKIFRSLELSVTLRLEFGTGQSPGHTVARTLSENGAGGAGLG